MKTDLVADEYLLEITKSFRGIKSNAEKAIEQISDEELYFSNDTESNSAAILIKHISGNMLSRFTNFLTTDGEKANRNRDDEFIDDHLSRAALFERWNKGWDCLFQALSLLSADDLLKIVKIRGEDHTVMRALNRQLVHYAYHTGQIVFICKQIRSTDFKSLSIPRKR